MTALESKPWAFPPHGSRGYFSSSFEVCNQNSASKEDDSNNYKERSRGYRVFQYIHNKNELIGSQTAIKKKDIS